MKDVSHSLNRRYLDPRGIEVTVVRWDAVNQQVIYKRDGYEHECMQPLEQFRKKFTRLS